MSYNIPESLVRERLRVRKGQIYCAVCLARDLRQDPANIRAAMDELAPRQVFSVGACPCGRTGLMYRR